MTKRLIALFIVFSPFTSYFAVSAWLRFPVLLLLLVFLSVFLKILLINKIQKNIIFKTTISDILLVFLLFSILTSLALNSWDPRGLNHMFAYIFTFLMYYVLLKKIFELENIDYLFILKMFAISSFLCGSIIILDWILMNFFKIGFRGYFVEADHRIANMLYYIKPYFIAVGGVAEEPGSMALFMNIICPLGMLYYKIQGKYKLLFSLTFIYALSMVFLASATGIINIIMAVLFLLFLYALSRGYNFTIRRKKLLLYATLSVVMLAASVIFYIIFKETLIRQYHEIEGKLLLNNQDVSTKVRSNIWKEALIEWTENPLLGSGPGSSVSEHKTNYHSVYLTLLADTGLFSFLLFIAFLILQFRMALKINSQYRNYILVPLITTTAHFAIVGDYYHAPFWILLILIPLIMKVQIPASQA